MSRFGPSQTGGIAVFHNHNPPSQTDTAETFPAFPISVGAVQNIAQLNSITPRHGAAAAQFIWSQRISRMVQTGAGTRPNPIRPAIFNTASKECRTQYSTVARAAMATRVMIRHNLGLTYGDLLAEAGLTPADVIAYADAVADADAIFTLPPDPGATPPHGEDFACCMDKIVLTNARLVDGPGPLWGVVLDHEVQDGRSAAQTLALVEGIAADCQAAGLKLLVYTNPLDGAMPAINGLTTGNLAQIMQLVDFVTVLLGVNSSTAGIYQSFLAQTAMLRGTTGTADVDWSKVCITLALSGDAFRAQQAGHIVRRLITDATPIRAIWFWPDLQPLGGDGDSNANRMIGATTLGLGMPSAASRRG